MNSSRDEEYPEIDDDGPRVRGMGPHDDWSLNFTTSQETAVLQVMDNDVPPSCKLTASISSVELPVVASYVSDGEDSPRREAETIGAGARHMKTPGRLGVVPPIPPCNPGRQDTSQTVRDGDAAGGAPR